MGFDICKAFEMESAKDAYEHIRMNMGIIKRYGSSAYGHCLYTWDAGARMLAKCNKCDCYILIQDSEYHAMDDSYYYDYFPISGEEEAEELNKKYDGFQIEREFPKSYLKVTDGVPSW